MNKYGPKAQEEIHKALEEFKKGTLKSGTGDKVTDRDQAIAIGISQARKKNYKTPAQQSD